MRCSWVVARATCPLRERLHVRDGAEIRLLERGDKNDKMIKMMVLMSTGEGRSTLCRTVQQQADPFRVGRRPAGVVERLLHQHLVVRRRGLGGLDKTPTTTSLAPSDPALAPANSRNQTQLPTWVGKQTAKTHSKQIERHALHGGGARWRGRTFSAAHKQTRRMVAQATGSVAPLVRTSLRSRPTEPTRTAVR